MFGGSVGPELVLVIFGAAKGADLVGAVDVAGLGQVQWSVTTGQATT